MLLIRIIGLLAALGIGALVLMYMVSGERRYLRIAWRAFKYALVLVLFTLGLFFFERLLVVP